MMNKPLLLLIITFALLLLVIAMFYYRNKIKKWRDRLSYLNARILIEDALKYFFESEYSNIPATIDGLAEKLALKPAQAKKVFYKLIALNLIKSDGNKYWLTNEGRLSALKIIRTHRLLERYLAEETSVPSSSWHMEAEFKEHRITDEELREISSLLGNPVLDPHGDPIPLASGIFHKTNSIPIKELNVNDFARITHIEDEPPDIYNQICKLNLYPGTQIKFISKDEKNILLELNGARITLNLNIANNISVIKIQADEILPAYLKPLSELEINKEAEIVKISEGLLGQQRRRLLDLGFVKGSKVKALLKGIGGDPTAYSIKNTTIALRENIAKWILVKDLQNE